MSSGTSDGVSARPEAAPKALPVPVRNASAKNGQTLFAPFSVTRSSALKTTTSFTTMSAYTVRLGNRSAT